MFTSVSNRRERWFHGLDVVSGAFAVMTTRRSPAEAGSIDCLDLTEFVEVYRQPEQHSPDLHPDRLFAEQSLVKSGSEESFDPNLPMLEGISYRTPISCRYR